VLFSHPTKACSGHLSKPHFLAPEGCLHIIPRTSV
jgi:hypothetical protein